jgi:hypothetical protein
MPGSGSRRKAASSSSSYGFSGGKNGFKVAMEKFKKSLYGGLQ